MSVDDPEEVAATIDDADGLVGLKLTALRDEQRKLAQAIGDGATRTPPIPGVMDLPEMRERLVYIAEGARVAIRGSPYTLLPFDEFRRRMQASKTLVPGLKAIPTANLWLEDPARLTVHTTTFHAGAGEFTPNPDGTEALNLWVPRARRFSSGEADVKAFLDHVAYLVPIEEERALFLDWLAHLEQRPGVLPHTHYLMVTPQTGIGRNWLASLLARVWPGETRLGFDLYGALRTGFNGPLSRRTLVVVDELKAADTGYSSGNFAQQLKAMLTTEVRTINPKYGRIQHEYNAARFLMFSQHDDALPLETHDRRVIVIDNPSDRKSPDYYARLYGLLDDPAFVNAVANYLAHRDINRFNPSKPAPLTIAKERAIHASLSDAEQLLIDLRHTVPFDLMTAREVAEYVRDCGASMPRGRGIATAYATAGLTPCAQKIAPFKKQERVVALRNADRYKAMAASELALEYRSQRGWTSDV